MDHDVEKPRSVIRRPWVAAIITALAIAGAALLAVSAWSFANDFDRGWPEGSRWWIVTVACSALVVAGLLVAILSVSRTAAPASAVVLAWSLAAFGVSVASWGQFASLADASSTRHAAAARCGKDIKAMSIEDIAASRYMSSVMMVRPMAATSLYMIPDLPAGMGGGGYASKQREAAAKSWETLRADSRTVADICAASLAQFGDATQGIGPATQGAVGYGSANTTGSPVDVIVG